MRLTDLWRRKGNDSKGNGGVDASASSAPAAAERHAELSGRVRLHAPDGHGGLRHVSGDVVANAGDAVTLRSDAQVEPGTIWWAVGEGQHTAVRVAGCDRDGEAYVLGAHVLPVDSSAAISATWVEYIEDEASVRTVPVRLTGAADGSVQLDSPAAIPQGEVVFVSGPSLGCLGKVVQSTGRAPEKSALVEIWTEAH